MQADRRFIKADLFTYAQMVEIGRLLRKVARRRTLDGPAAERQSQIRRPATKG